MQKFLVTQMNIAQKWQTLCKLLHTAVHHQLSPEQEQKGKKKKNQDTGLTGFSKVGRSFGEDAKCALCPPHSFKKYSVIGYLLGR